MSSAIDRNLRAHQLMSIRVFSQEGPGFDETVSVYSLTYDCKDGSFKMAAGTHLIVPLHSFKPILLRAGGSALLVEFETSAEAGAFCEWLKEASSQAEHNFTQMTD